MYWASTRISSNYLILTTTFVALMLVAGPLVEGLEQPLGKVLTPFQSVDCAQVSDEHTNQTRSQTYGDTELQCVRKCSHDLECTFCTLNETQDGTRLCSLYSSEISFEDIDTASADGVNDNSLPTTTLSATNQLNLTNEQTSQLPDLQSIQCQAFFISRCNNGGVMRNGICKCTEEYTGQYCDIPNQSYCRREWIVVPTSDTSNVDQLPEENVKVGFDDPDTGARIFIKTSDAIHGIVYFCQALFTMEKGSWDTYEDDPRRIYRLFRSDGKMQIMRISRDNSTSEYVENNNTVFIAPKTTPYQTVCSNSYTDILSQIRLGYEMKREGFLHVDDQLNIISAHSSQIELGEQAGSFLDRPYYFSFSLNIDQATGTTRRYVVRTELRNLYAYSVSSNNAAATAWDFSPCRVPVDFDKLTGGIIGKTKLDAYLKNGHGVRVVMDERESSNVLETLQHGTIFTFVLFSKLTTEGPHDLNTHSTQSFLSPERDFTVCKRSGDSDVIISTGSSQIGEVKCAHYGDARDLSQAIQAGSDVRIWILYLETNYNRYMDVYANSVLNDTLVSSESYVTWRLYDCRSETVLVTTEGKMKVATVAYGPGDTNMPPLPLVTNVYDVLITWFVA